MHEDIYKILIPPTCVQIQNLKTITIKRSIQIKLELYHYLSYDKIFKIDNFVCEKKYANLQSNNKFIKDLYQKKYRKDL